MAGLPAGLTSVLVIEGIDLPPYSMRGLSQTLEPVEQATQIMTTINGDAVDVSDTAFRKLKSTITGQDHQSPAWCGVWPGVEVVVHCIKYRVYKTATGEPDREVVESSSYTDGDYTFFRPKLTMLVAGYTGSYAEYEPEVPWTLSLIEVSPYTPPASA